MNLFTYIGENIDRIRMDVKVGITSYCDIKHWLIYSRYDYYRKTGLSVSKAVMFAGQDHKVSDKWVYDIIKKMEAGI